ncbi:MAG: sulfatase [Verrucomicrobiia bacterium]|jgi:iduronate 2-sulfatase
MNTIFLIRFLNPTKTASIVALTLICSSLSAAPKPDVLMIAIDDLRPMLGCYGDPRIQTPNIDRLAARGVVFDHAYCQYAKCGTSRLSLMTGLRPDSIGVFSNSSRDVKAFRKRRPDAVSMARHLKNSGYNTRGFGKIYHDGWDVTSDWSQPPSPGREKEMLEVTIPEAPKKPTIIAERFSCPIKQSPDVPDNHLFAGRMTEQVIKTMRSRNDSKPLFLAVGYRRPHLPFIAPKRYFDLYQPDDSWLAPHPTPSKASPIMAWYNSDGYVGGARRVGLTMPNPPTRQEAIDWNGYEMRSYVGVPNHGPITRELQFELLQAYAACVTYVDTQIGKLLDELERSKRDQNTIIVLWSDHGWHLGEHSAWGKMTNFEIATRVPMIISVPGIRPARTGAIAELVDLYPTLCELTEVEVPQHLEGESLASVLRKPSKPSDSIALSQYARFGTKYMGRAIRTARYRYVSWREKKSGKRIASELYDHSVDPNETRNLAAKSAQLAKSLETRLQKAFAR